MFASSTGPRSALRRRGIVLVLVLGMLGLMALIGVTFATFAGQSLKNGRNFSQGLARPQPETLMDYALAQLINDTNNPLSAIRGHSLLRDMYGQDSVFRGFNPPGNAVAETGGLLTTVYDSNASVPGYYPLQFIGAPARRSATATVATPFYNQLQYRTNIPTTGPYYGYDFTRWIIRFTNANGQAQTSTVAQTFEILEDDFTGTYHRFTLSANLGNPTFDPNFTSGTIETSSDTQSFIYGDPNQGAATPSGTRADKGFTALNRELGGALGGSYTTNSNAFVLDGRYMRAFNGPGLTQPSIPFSNPSVTFAASYPFNRAAYGNMRVIGSDPAVRAGADVSLFGLGNPDAVGMDEDYDACDLENWFLAIQSADGQVMIPSFHRPGILTADDWTLPVYDTTVNPPVIINAPNRAKILRPRQIDNSPLFPYDPSVVDPTSRRLTYDIDNDGDGVTDSVWLDLGYPVQRDPNGKLYKPLFAFMVLGLNGRLPLNTVGNLQARAIGDTSYNSPDGVTYLTSTGQVPYPGYYSTSGNHHPGFSSQVFFDAPLFDHTSHLGYSVNEINPKFALQNAPSNLYGSADGVVPSNAQGVYSQINPANNRMIASFTQYDDAGVSVALTQLRNILTGTMPTDLPNPYPTSATVRLPVNSSYLLVRNGSTLNDDLNVVAVDGRAFVFPNNMADLNDANATTSTYVPRTTKAVAGRWGEPEAMPTQLPFPSQTNQASDPRSYSDPSYPSLVFNNLIRAGRSNYNGGTNDGVDDDYDAFDPFLANAKQIFTVNTTSTPPGGPDVIPLYPSVSQIAPPAYAGGTFYRTNPEDADAFDNAGQIAVASERARRFVTPQDTSGSGRMVALMPTPGLGVQTRPLSDHDYGRGADTRGRVGFFRYFRPAGMPQEVIYPYYDGGANAYTDNTNTVQPGSSTFANYSYLTNNNKGQRYLMPVLLPAGQTASAPHGAHGIIRASTPDVTSNLLHGLQAAMTPQIVGGANPLAAQTIATVGAMPFDNDPYTGGAPAGYNDTVMDINAMAPPSSSRGLKIQLFSPTINPNDKTTGLIIPYLFSAVNTESGPNLGPVGNYTGGAYPIYYGDTYDTFNVQDYNGNNVGGTFTRASGAPVVNGYLGGSLNKDEADEMNLYSANSRDMPFGPTDLEWLYRKHDVDGSTLTSRLAQLAPVSFLNSADGLTRRRLFSTDSMDLINFAYANDNPPPYAGILGGHGSHSTDHDFTYNSRFMPQASPSLELMNQVVNLDSTTLGFYQFANPITTEFLPNPTLPTHTGNGDSFGEYVPNSSFGPSGSGVIPRPRTVNHANPNSTANAPTSLYAMFDFPNPNTNPTSGTIDGFINAIADPSTNLIHPYGTTSAAQVQTPSVAHRDRKINLNMPLPISNDPAEPVRQKWCRETYQFLKAILPPASVDTPEELAALSQYVVNIIDFRDPDCTLTRFVNTDLVVTDVLTKTASPTQLPSPPLPSTFNPIWTVSPSGVRFANSGDNFPASIFPNPPHFPYDPSLYSPDATPNSIFLVQHGMEYNPIAINEALAYNAEYAVNSTDTTPTRYSAMFIELVNTLSESQNNPKGTLAQSGVQNSSSISLTGWDIVVLPDSYGWGRPDPTTGDINPVVMPVYKPNTGGSITTPPAPTDWINPATDPYWKQLQQAVAQFSIPPHNPIIPAPTAPPYNTSVNAYIHGISGTSVDHYVIGDYRTGSGSTAVSFPGDSTKIEGATPVAKTTNTNEIDIHLPDSSAPRPFPLPSTPNPGGMSYNLQDNQGTYFWVYLRRPANPFDTDTPNQVHPNKEMVVVDAMRFPVISATGAKINSPPNNGKPFVNTVSANTIYSAQRMQPFRGGHLVAQNTDINDTKRAPIEGPPITPLPPASPQNSANPQNGVTTVCPPSPPYAYGYSEQIAPPPTTGNGAGSLPLGANDPNGNPQTQAMTKLIQQSINNANGTTDTNWAHFPFHDRDFSNVAELLLVPGCPPGLFTKQFVEEPYPGNIFANAAMTLTATGTDYTNTFAKAPTGTTIAAPTGGTNPSLVGRQNFIMVGGTLPAALTFPYLTDNFYYTAASVSPPIGAAALDAGYTHLTTEIGGWTGAGWHKMMEFFEVPSSANGAIGTADQGDNYDWYRADTKPGLLNLNLIIDEEVFAGLIDDPRLNEGLAYGAAEASIPYIVNQIDAAGYPAHTPTGASAGDIIGRQPIFKPNSTNNIGGIPTINPYGRGYVYRDPVTGNYPGGAPTQPSEYQQVHGVKAAFSDFLKLRHGGSGYLFAHGGGDVGMGNYVAGSLTLASGVPSPPTKPVAADRPYRSLSYPDINYTIMRPASLPPTPATAVSYPYLGNTVNYAPLGTMPNLPLGLSSLYSYNANAYPSVVSPANDAPFVQLLAGNVANITPNVNDATTNSPLAPMNETTMANRYQYIQDPGIKNPFLAVQYANPTSPTATGPTRRLAPPYDTLTGPTSSPATPIAAPFPAPIPPTPARRLFQIPDYLPSSNASLLGGFDSTKTVYVNQYAVNQQITPPTLSSTTVSPPTLVLSTRPAFLADNFTTTPSDNLNNFLGAGPTGTPPVDDYRQHPVYRTEMLQKISNLTTVRTHQFATWITVGFFEVVRTGTPELGIPDVLGQEVGSAAGKNVRYRSFFVLDRTKATGFNPYYPGNFRDCVTYRRRIE